MSLSINQFPSQLTNQVRPNNQIYTNGAIENIGAIKRVLVQINNQMHHLVTNGAIST